MTESHWMSLVYLTAALVLVSSNFWGRQFALGAMVRMAMIWLGIFVIAFLIVDQREAIGRALGIIPTEQGPPPRAPDRGAGEDLV